MTNFEKLKSMSVDEFAEFLAAERLTMIEPIAKQFNFEIPAQLATACAIVIRTWLEKESEESIK